MTVLLSVPPSGGIGEGVVEGIEGTVRRDRQLEAISDTGVLDRDREGVLGWVPEQQDMDSVALAGGELEGLPCCGGHGSSFSSGSKFGRLHASTLRARRQKDVVAKPDSTSHPPTIRARTRRR